MSKNQFTGTATQPQCNRKFCQLNKDQYCNCQKHNDYGCKLTVEQQKDSYKKYLENKKKVIYTPLPKPVIFLILNALHRYLKRCQKTCLLILKVKKHISGNHLYPGDDAIAFKKSSVA